MIVTLTMKSPDCLDYLVDDLKSQLASEQLEDEVEKLYNITRKFVKYGEYVYIDIDTEKGTANIRELSR